LAIAHKPGLPARGAVTETKPQGAGTAGLKRDPGEPVTAQGLQRVLVEIFNAPNYRPPMLPRVAMQLTSLTRRPSVAFEEVAAVLQKDPMLAGSVLKVAQSAVYGAGRPPQTLKQALQRLGIKGLRDVVWQVVTGMRLFRAGNLTTFMEHLQTHNQFVAHAARLIAVRADIVEEEAFLCGLLHDVGISATVSALVDTAAPLPQLPTLLAAIDASHEHAGGLVAGLWQLSPQIVAVIKQHHRFGPHVRDGAALAAVICVAERMASELGCAASKESTDQAFDQQPAAAFDAAIKRLDLGGKYNALLQEGKELSRKLVDRP
jgi:HD-like signal output (HDOD) protein